MTGHGKEPGVRFVIRLYIKPLREIQVQFFCLRIREEIFVIEISRPAINVCGELMFHVSMIWIVGDSPYTFASHSW
jgi:hypothetical protein